MKTILILGVVLAGCNSAFNDCIDGRFKYPRGVYGQLSNGCDTHGCTVSYMIGATVTLDAPSTDGGLPGSPEVTTTDSEGFYQFNQEVGDWSICTGMTTEAACSTISITASAPKVRWDFTTGPGGGNWFLASECTK